MNISVAIVLCCFALAQVHAVVTKTVTLAPSKYAWEQIDRNSPTSYDVTCTNCDVYIMAFNDFSNFQAGLPYNYYTQYSAKNTYHFAYANIQLNQAGYFVVLNRANTGTISVTYSLFTNQPTILPTSAPSPSSNVISTVVPIAVAVIVSILILSIVCIVCVRRRLRKRRENAYAQVGTYSQPYPVSTQPQYVQAPYVQPQPQPYMQAPYVQAPYVQPQPVQDYYTQPVATHDPYYQQNVTPSAPPIYKI
jgi:hypothetical protein